MNSSASKGTSSEGSGPPTPRIGSRAGKDSKVDRSTGTRPVSNMPTPEIHEAPVPEGSRLHPSVAPESLRKPYASLSPKKLSEGPTESTPDLPPTTPESGASLRPRPSRGICRKHRIAKGKDGECMLCSKEADRKEGSFTWRLIVLLMLMAVAGASLAALLR